MNSHPADRLAERRNSMMSMAEEAGIAPNTILHWEAAFLRFADLLAASLAKQQAQVPAAQSGDDPLTASYVQAVPDKCDRITWRGRYYHLPLTPSPQEPTVAQAGLELSDHAIQAAYKQFGTGRLDGFTEAVRSLLEFAQAGTAPQVIDKVDAETERIAFEAWAVTEGFKVERGSKGFYASLGTNQQFSGWLARAAIAATGEGQKS